MDKIAKLPKWAQYEIANLRRDRDMAIRALNEHLDRETESPFYFDDLVCTGEEKGPSFKRKYVQTHKMTVKHAGVELVIVIRRGDESIDMHWNAPGQPCQDVAFIPTSFQAASLKAKENMR